MNISASDLRVFLPDMLGWSRVVWQGGALAGLGWSEVRWWDGVGLSWVELVGGWRRVCWVGWGWWVDGFFARWWVRLGCIEMGFVCMCACLRAHRGCLREREDIGEVQDGI